MMSEQLDLFGEPIVEVPPQVPQKPERGINPCLALYGPGPQGQTCKGCIHLRYLTSANPNARHWKCDLRKVTHGAATDHKVRWPACGRYERRTEEYHGS